MMGRATNNGWISGGGRSVVREILRDSPFYWAILAYAFLVTATAFAIGHPGKLIPFAYLGRWLTGVAIVATIYVSFLGIRCLGTETPLSDFRRKIALVTSPNRMAGFMLFFWLAIFHGVFTSAKTMLSDIAPFTLDVYFADLDAALHGGDPWQLLPMVPLITLAVQWLYLPVWFMVLAGISLYATMIAPRDLRNRYVWTFMLCWVVLGNVVALLGMSAGPAFYEQVTGSPRFSPLIDYLSFTGGTFYGTADIQAMLWDKYAEGRSDVGSGISAFPSLHLAMVTLWALMGWKIRAWIGYTLSCYALIILIGSVHLGWHYAVDGYFSIIAAAAIWKFVGAVQSITAPRPMAAEIA